MERSLNILAHINLAKNCGWTVPCSATRGVMGVHTSVTHVNHDPGAASKRAWVRPEQGEGKWVETFPLPFEHIRQQKLLKANEFHTVIIDINII